MLLVVADLLVSVCGSCKRPWIFDSVKCIKSEGSAVTLDLECLQSSEVSLFTGLFLFQSLYSIVDSVRLYRHKLVPTSNPLPFNDVKQELADVRTIK